MRTSIQFRELALCGRNFNRILGKGAKPHHYFNAGQIFEHSFVFLLFETPYEPRYPNIFNMPSWTHLVRFIAEEDGESYYASCDSKLLKVGEKVEGFKTIAALERSDASDSNTFAIKEVSKPGYLQLSS